MLKFCKNKSFRLILTAAAISCAVVFCSLFELHGSQKKSSGTEKRHSDRQLSDITVKALQVFSKRHYRLQELTPQFAENHFNSYLKALDPNRSFFTAGDIKSFNFEGEKWVKALAAGDNNMAFRIYERYKERYSEYRHFAEKMLSQPLDFSKDEKLTVDRSKLPYCADDKALQDLWRKRLKNEILSFRLHLRALKESKENDDKKELKEIQLWSKGTPEDQALRRLRDVGNEISKKEKIDILGIYLSALAHVYGPHSNYMPPRAVQDFDIDMSLSLSGIGATLTSDNGYIKVVSLVPGGPAALGGKLKVNDRIIAVTQENGQKVSVVDLPVSKAVQYIRGPEKSKVILTVLKGDKGPRSAPEQIEICRNKVQLVDDGAKGRIIRKNGKNIGYIELPSFYMDFEAAIRGDANAKRCSVDVFRILQDFKKKSVDAVVMDLRRNGGGSLAEAIALTGLFIPTGPVVQRRRSGYPQTNLEMDDDPVVAWKGPLVIMTSKLSASSAEIFTAALRDSDRAVVVGDSRTFGKGTVLNVEKLDNRFTAMINPSGPSSGSVTYEIEMFYRISGSSVQQMGIASDIRVPSITDEMKIGEMFMEHHLPWDCIDPVNRDRYVSDLPEKIAELKKKSAVRVAASPEFKAVERRIKLYRAYRKRNEISLSEKIRWKDYLEEKHFIELEKKEMGLDKKSSKDKLDPAAHEAVAIAADFHTLIGR